VPTCTGESRYMLFSGKSPVGFSVATEHYPATLATFRRLSSHSNAQQSQVPRRAESKRHRLAPDMQGGEKQCPPETASRRSAGEQCNRARTRVSRGMIEDTEVRRSRNWHQRRAGPGDRHTNVFTYRVDQGLARLRLTILGYSQSQRTATNGCRLLESVRASEVVLGKYKWSQRASEAERTLALAVNQPPAHRLERAPSVPYLRGVNSPPRACSLAPARPLSYYPACSGILSSPSSLQLSPTRPQSSLR